LLAGSHVARQTSFESVLGHISDCRSERGRSQRIEGLYGRNRLRHNSSDSSATSDSAHLELAIPLSKIQLIARNLCARFFLCYFAFCWFPTHWQRSRLISRCRG